MIAASDHTAVMGRFDMANWGLKLQELKEAATSAEGEVTRIPANWKSEDLGTFIEALKEELSKEGATLTNIALMIDDVAKRHAWK